MSASFAFGLRLRLTTTQQGGRVTPLHLVPEGTDTYLYRSNWGLPRMTPPDQTGAPFVACSHELVRPGDEVLVVIAPVYAEVLAAWEVVAVDDLLLMYEGSRVCGHGRVLWRRMTRLPVPAEDVALFRTRVKEASM